MTPPHGNLPADVILSINRILDIQPDEQDADNAFGELSDAFTPIAALNAYFPDESSLSQVEVIQRRLGDQQKQLQEEIDSLKAELKTDQDPSRMALIQEMISDLLGQMTRIREKATESEAVVRNVTKDIQVLDLAKKNLITSMTTLKRLQMLVNALTQLEVLVKEKKYDEIAQTLSAVKQISVSFKPFSSIHRIAQILKRIQEIQGELRSMIDDDFDTFYMQDPSKPIKGSVIADACLVIDVLGDDVRLHVIDRYVVLELKEYRRIFRATDEAGQLDNISRRFAWFRRLLQTHEVEQGRVFPPEWKVGWHLLAKFAEVTRDDLTSLLSQVHSSLTVTSLLEYLQTTTEFEAAMSKKWGTPFKELISTASPSSARAPKLISAAFESHMSIFVDAQEKAIADMLAPHRHSKNKKAQPRPSLEASEEPEEESNVLPSSTELFYFYRQSLEQCAKLSTGQPLFDLCNVHKKWLKVYAEDVLTSGPKKLTVQTRRSMDTRFDPVELRHTCLLINTADYCYNTASELEERIREQVNDEFKEKVTLQAEMDLFLGVISSSIATQLREVEAACEPSFSTLVRTSWPSINQVSGSSAYANELINSVERCLGVVKAHIEQKKYLRNLFDKTCSLILAKLTNALVKSRPLGETGAEQLLIDLQIIKAFLLKLPGDDVITSSYTKTLTKNTTQLEALLKVIVTPVDPPEGFILNYTLLIGDASFSNFQKILDLKGTPKPEQNDLLDSFVTVTSTKDELERTSFLSSLDMDPPVSNQGQLMVDPTSPGLSARVSFPQVVGAAMNAANIGSEGLLAGLVSPPMSGPPTGSNGVDTAATKREVFSGFGRFVSFGRRRDTQGPS